MGTKEYIAWREAVERSIKGSRTDPDSWEGSEDDPEWRAMRERHRKAMGR